MNFTAEIADFLLCGAAQSRRYGIGNAACNGIFRLETDLFFSRMNVDIDLFRRDIYVDSVIDIERDMPFARG